MHDGMSDGICHGVSDGISAGIGDGMSDIRVADASNTTAPALRLRRWLAPAVLAAVASGWPALAAADPAPTDPTPATPPVSERVQFVDMGEMLIDGAAVRPAALYINSRARLHFERLRKLEFQVLGRLRQTAHDPGLR